MLSICIKLIIIVIVSFLSARLFLFPIDPLMKLASYCLPVFLAFSLIHPIQAFYFLIIFRPIIDPFRNYGFGFVSVLGIFSFLNIILVFIAITKNKEFNFFPKTIVFYYAFTILAMISLIGVTNTNTAILYVFKLLSLAAIFLLSYNLIRNKRDAYSFLRCILISAIIPIVYGLYQLSTNQRIMQDMSGFKRLYSTFAFSNPFAFYLGLIIFTVILLKTSFFNKKIRMFDLLILLGAAVCLVFTYVRVVWIACALSLIFITVFEKRLRRFILPALISVIIMFSVSLFSRFTDILKPDAERANTLEFRIDISRQLIQKALPNYWLSGSGIGSSEEVAAKYTTYANLPHNDYVRVLLETGAIGFFFYMTFFGSLMFYFIAKMKRSDIYDTNVVFLGILLFYLFASSGQNCFTAVSASGYVFCLMGFAVKVNELSVEEKVRGDVR